MAGEIKQAKWSGEIMGVGVHVLEDGTRIVDAQDLEDLFSGKGRFASLDLAEFAAAFKKWSEGGNAPDEKPVAGDAKR